MENPDDIDMLLLIRQERERVRKRLAELELERIALNQRASDLVITERVLKRMANEAACE